MVISTATRSSAALSTVLACALSCSAHANLTQSYREMISGAPTLDQVRQCATNLPRSAEVISQSLYDHVRYIVGGRVVTDFFSVPVGSGLGTYFVGNNAPKTFADTNIEGVGNRLPFGVAHLVTSLEFTFAATFNNPIWSGVASSGQQAVLDNIATLLNGGGLIRFCVGNDTVLATRLAAFPPRAILRVDGAYAFNVGGANNINGHGPYAAGSLGEPFLIDPPILISSNQTFKLSIEWMPPVTLTTANPIVIGAYLNGYRYRYSQ